MIYNVPHSKQAQDTLGTPLGVLYGPLLVQHLYGHARPCLGTTENSLGHSNHWVSLCSVTTSVVLGNLMTKVINLVIDYVWRSVFTNTITPYQLHR